MTCMGCVRSVTKVLEQTPGVAKAEVSLEQGRATVSYDPAKSGVEQFRKAIEGAGFEVA
jgi:copper chaperone